MIGSEMKKIALDDEQALFHFHVCVGYTEVVTIGVNKT